MRILMLSQFYPPFIGGEEQHVETLCIELAKRGHNITVATLWRPGLAEHEVDAHGIHIYRIHSLTQSMPWLFADKERPFAPPFPDPGITKTLKEIITKEKPEIVHTHNWIVYSFLPLKAWSKIPLIVTLHNFNLVCAKMTLMRNNVPCSGPSLLKCLECAGRHYGIAKGTPTVIGNWTMSKIERKAVDMFISVSNAVATDNKLVEDKLPFEIIPNFLPDNISPEDTFDQAYIAKLPQEDFLLFVGALGYAKGINTLIEAYNDLKHRIPLVLIGYTTPEWQELAKQIPDNIFVFENWPHHAVMAAWKRCMIALIPSIWKEPFGIVAIEAMSQGKPIIASRIGGLTDIVIDGETGILVEPGNTTELRSAIDTLVSNPEKRKDMARAALLRTQIFKAETIIPQIEKVYKKALK